MRSLSLVIFLMNAVQSVINALTSLSQCELQREIPKRWGIDFP